MRATRIAIVGAAILAVGAALWIGFKRSPMFFPAPQSASVETPPLGLNIEKSGHYLRVSWNRNHPVLRKSKQAVLSILEGSKERRVRFDSRDLASSTVLYEVSSSDVTVNLNVRDDQNRYVSESVRAIAMVPAAAPLPAAPIVERKPQSSSIPQPVAPPVSQPVPETPARDTGVVSKAMPVVTARARASIRGTVRVDVKVNVSEFGTVTSAVLNEPARSPFFAQLAIDAARKWRLSPGEPVEHVVRFEFTTGADRAFLLN